MKINWIEVGQTSTGKVKADITFEGDDKRVTAWGDFPNFANLKAGMDIEGSIVPKVVGNKTYYTIYPPKGNLGGQGFKRPNAGIEKNMDRKDASITKTMDRKEEGIREAAIMRDSALLTAAWAHGQHRSVMGNPISLDTEEIKDAYENFRKFVTNQWNIPF